MPTLLLNKHVPCQQYRTVTAHQIRSDQIDHGAHKESDLSCRSTTCLLAYHEGSTAQLSSPHHQLQHFAEKSTQDKANKQLLTESMLRHRSIVCYPGSRCNWLDNLALL
jgi:hypothetical protein